MAGVKGKSGRKDKDFAEAVRMVVLEIDKQRGGKKKLRCLAEKLYEEAMNGEGWAMAQIADRMDGKPAQEQTVTIDDKRDASDWTRDELVRVLNDARNSGARAAEAEGRGREPDSVH
jgi:hypothetical protein